jgi:hypothetical protein
MPEPKRSNPLDYATPGITPTDKRAELLIVRRIALGLGLGLMCFGAGWGLARSGAQVETAWMMGAGGWIVGIAAPSFRR